MDHKTISQYMTTLKASLLDAHFNTVNINWRDSGVKLTHNKMYYIDSGEGTITIDGRSYYPVAGDLLFIPEGSTISYTNISPKRYTKYWCHFNAYVGTTPLSECLNIPIIKSIGSDMDLTRIFTEMIAAFNSSDGFSPLKAHGLLLELLYHYFSILCVGEITLHDNLSTTKIHTLLTFMDDHLYQKMTIDDFSRAMNLHPNYLIRLFKNTFGTSPMDYFNQMKIKKAKELLKSNDRPIREIADELGFSTPYYFSYVFKNQTGYTPSYYRKLA